MKQRTDYSNSHNNNNMDLDDLCAFCLDPIHDPVQLHCKHYFCRSCLSLYREARNWQAKRCPLCRRSLEACPNALQHSTVSKGSWRLTFVLLLALMLFSLGPFYLLLIYW
ncbi:PREDICTED: E3 ubiquitin-protein ligase rnf146 [Drosophila arizonae]|uniref:E3 ubiquitin-protein ligase rnf146 n=1 Tax=Drosophila arizonae TaxID=7263 RepID=A0ABM1PBI0_DROAR|nr:PREDICTED: E3 ubiquitin-protein ligase rnf146 [Drosophila arizonae]